MARQLNDVLELEEESHRYEEALHFIKIEVARLRREYFDGALSLSHKAIIEVSEEVSSIQKIIETALYG